MDQRTQNDIVNQHLQSLQIGEVLEDKLKFPLLESTFVIMRPKSKLPSKQNERIRLPLVLKASTSTRDEIAAALTQSLQYRNDIVGMNWVVGDDYVEVVREPGTFVNLSPHVTEEDVQIIFGNILKSRALIKKFSWDFSSTFVKVSYENSQFA